MKFLWILLAVGAFSFSQEKPVSKLVKFRVDICRDSLAPLVVTADLGEEGTVVSCVCSSESVMMAGYTFFSDSISFNENDTLLSREDAKRMILAMERIPDPQSLQVRNVSLKKDTFYVFCKYQQQSGYILISSIETYL